MAARDRQNTVVLFSDVPGDERKVCAILADWGVAEDSIRRLLTEARANQPAPNKSVSAMRVRATNARRHAPRAAEGH